MSDRGLPEDCDAGVGIKRGGEEYADQFVVGLDQRKLEVEGGCKALSNLALGKIWDLLDELCGEGFIKRQDELFLATEVAIGEAEGRTGFSRDLAEGCILVTICTEKG